MLTKLPPLRGWSKAPDPDYENRLLYWIETDVGEYQLKPRRTIKGNKKIYSAWRGSVFISNHNTAAQAAKAAAEDFKFTWSTKGYNSEANPDIRAQVRRLPSGQIQLKIPLGRQNPQEVVRGLKRVLGRRVKAVQMVGGKGNPDWKWQGPWVVLVKSQSTGEAINSLSATFPTEGAARIYRTSLIQRGLHRGRIVELLHNTGTNAPGGVKVVSSKAYR